MSRLNFSHLRYFWAVAREGSVTGAAELLNVTQPTISLQIQKLERALGVPLFLRQGNRLELTDAGRTVQEYAAEIFSLADAMTMALHEGTGEVGHRFSVGIVDSLPLLSAYRLLEPALTMPEDEVRLQLRVGKKDRLLAALAAHSIDLILSDEPAGPASPVRVRDHLLVESGVAVFGTRELMADLEGGFPECLEGAPFLMHTQNTPLRRGLDTWLARKGLRVRVAGEVEQVALLQVMGRTGRGFFVAPTMVESEVCRDYHVHVVGHLDGVVERFFALTLHDPPANPAIKAVLQAGG